MIELGVCAYVNKQARVTAEDFARELRDDRQIAAPRGCTHDLELELQPHDVAVWTWGNQPD